MGEVQKKCSRKGKLNEKKIDARQLTLQNIHAMAKKIHSRNLMTKKNSCGSKIPHPSHNISNDPSLTGFEETTAAAAAAAAATRTSKKQSYYK